jgi:hypothetical protein
MADANASRIPDVVVSVASNAIFFALCLIARRIRNRFERSRRTVRAALIVILGFLYLAANLLYEHYVQFGFEIFFVISSLGVAWVVLAELYQFWRIGLMGADKTIAGGLGFKESLDLCTNSLEFMGIAASKLTGEKTAFEKAIVRCHRENKPIRFLLCDPSSNELIKMARQANKPDKEYQENAKKSLRVLAEMKLSRERNIEVRFYKALPLFRLMFIDDVLCLASHYVFGEGDGSQLPQLHVRRPTSAQRDVETLYHPFRTYFERVWQESAPWDFRAGMD